MKTWLSRLHDFWFTAAPPANLALLRILVGSYTLWYVGSRYEVFLRIARASSEMFDPVGLAVIHASPLAPVVFQVLLVWILLLNVAFLLGCGFRVSGPCFAFGLLWLLSYRNSWSMIYHSDNLLVLGVLVLGFSRAADALSIDACLRRIVRPAGGQPANKTLARWPAASWHYGWPLRLMCAFTVASYLLAGIAKVAGPLGWTWPMGEALRAQLAVDALRKTVLDEGGSPLVELLYPYGWIFTILGVVTLWLELAAPLVLFDRRLGRGWALAAWSFHWGVFLVMGIKFRYQLCGIAFAPFFLQPITRRQPSIPPQQEHPLHVPIALKKP